MSIEVLQPGLLSTVQDGGRRGLQQFGIGAAGALDADALRLANLLVGNPADAAGLEMTARGPTLRFRTAALIALTGAEIQARIGAQEVPLWRPLLLRAGSELVLGGMRHGMRSYLAVAGGIAVESVLGSRSSDLHAGLGPAPLRSGMILPCQPDRRERYPGLWQAFEHGTAACQAARWSLDPAPWFDAAMPLQLHALRGAHFAQLEPAAQRSWFGAVFATTHESNRVGCRLHGPPLHLRAPLELISEGVSTGTVQLPPAGQPIVLLAEHPTTGGYPRIAQIASIDLGKMAQARPEQPLRFVEIDLAQAQTRYLAQRVELERIGMAIADRLQR